MQASGIEKLGYQIIFVFRSSLCCAHHLDLLRAHFIQTCTGNNDESERYKVLVVDRLLSYPSSKSCFPPHLMWPVKPRTVNRKLFWNHVKRITYRQCPKCEMILLFMELCQSKTYCGCCGNETAFAIASALPLMFTL